MELISGIARNVRSTGAETLNVDLDGRGVRLELPAGEGHSLVQDGDALIIAGHTEAETVVGYAYRDITQGYSCRSSCQNDAFQGWLTLIFALGALWGACDAQSEIALFLWLQRILFFALAALFAVFTIVYLIMIIEKFLASFLVNQAALETLRGTASNIRHSTDNCAAFFDVDARHIELVMPRKIAIAAADEVVITGQRAGDVLAGLSYRNLTQGAIGRSWSVFGLVSTVVLIGVMLALIVTGLWLSGEEAAFFIVIRRALALAFMMGVLIFALDRFFRWRLAFEAWRRARADA
jgi:hypothetical protein